MPNDCEDSPYIAPKSTARIDRQTKKVYARSVYIWIWQVLIPPGIVSAYLVIESTYPGVRGLAIYRNADAVILIWLAAIVGSVPLVVRLVKCVKPFDLSDVILLLAYIWVMRLVLWYYCILFGGSLAGRYL